MKLLVAGGAGYLGSVLIPRLLDRGYDVDVVELFWFGNHLPNQVGILNKDIFHLTRRRSQAVRPGDVPRRSLERPDGGIFAEQELRP